MYDMMMIELLLFAFPFLFIYTKRKSILGCDDTMMPLISIIVPIYNVEKYPPAWLDSLLAQT
jgi:cellulose synthase/poly-beta-1,6-N-acetylglucosamine synthase-like glycosyltransferase